MLQFLATAYSSPCLGTITRRPLEGWKSEPVAWGLERIAAAVHSGRWVVGIRPEGQIRAIWVDIDRKPQAVSPYWHPCGQSRQLQRLEQEAAAAGCITTTLRSSASGGLHVVIAMPEALPAWKAHWVGAELLARSGMELAAGQAELFPSRLTYSVSPDPKDWAQSHGVRLPGQEGSALLVGDRLATDTDLIYQQLLADLEATEAGPLWSELLEAARSRQKAAEGQPQGHTPRRSTTRAHGVCWTAAGQTNENLGRLTTWARAAHPHIRTVAELAPIIEAAAIAAPGFAEHASELSQQDLSAWCARWARCSLRREQTPAPHTPEVADKHHNRRLFLQSRAALTKLWRSMQAAATELSQRAVAELSGLNRKNVRRHWDFWLQLLGGPHPSLTGGAGPAVVPLLNQSISSSISPAASALPATIAATVPTEGQTFAHTLKPSRLARRAAESMQSKPSREGSRPPKPSGTAPPELPFRADDRPPDPWRARQRAELAAWLGLAT